MHGSRVRKNSSGDVGTVVSRGERQDVLERCDLSLRNCVRSKPVRMIRVSSARPTTSHSAKCRKVPFRILTHRPVLSGLFPPGDRPPAAEPRQVRSESPGIFTSAYPLGCYERSLCGFNMSSLSLSFPPLSMDTILRGVNIFRAVVRGLRGKY